MIYRDFCAKVHTVNNFKVVLLLEVVIKEKSFVLTDDCEIVNITITPVAILSIKTTKEAAHFFQFAKVRFLQSELKSLFKEKLQQLIDD